MIGLIPYEEDVGFEKKVTKERIERRKQSKQKQRKALKSFVGLFDDKKKATDEEVTNFFKGFKSEESANGVSSDEQQLVNMPTFVDAPTDIKPSDKEVPWILPDVPGYESIGKQLYGSIIELPTNLAWGILSWTPAMVLQHSWVAGRYIDEWLIGSEKTTAKEKAVMGKNIADWVQTLGGFATPKTEIAAAGLDLAGKIMTPVDAVTAWITQGIDEKKYPNFKAFMNTITVGSIFSAMPKVSGLGGIGIGKVKKIVKARKKMMKKTGEARGEAAIEIVKKRQEVLGELEKIASDPKKIKNILPEEIIGEVPDIPTITPHKTKAKSPPPLVRDFDATLKKAKKQKVADISKSAQEAGLGLSDYLKEKGIGHKERKNIIKINDQLRLEHPFITASSKPMMTQAKDTFVPKIGEDIVNVGKKANSSVPIGSDMLDAAYNVKRLGKIPFIKDFETAPQAFKSFQSPKIQQLHYWWQDANLNLHNDKLVLKEHIKNIATKYPDIKLRKEAGVAGHARSNTGKIAMEQQGEKFPSNVKYKNMLDDFEVLFQDLIERGNDIRESIGQKRIKPLLDDTGKNIYLPFLAHESWLNSMRKTFKGKSLRGEKPNFVLDHTGSVEYRYRPDIMTATYLAHLKRGKVGKGTILETDILRLYAKYADTMLNHIHMSPLNAYVHEFVKVPLKYPKKYDKPGKSYHMEFANPELAEFLGRWSNKIAGKSNLTTTKFIDNSARIMSKNLTASTLMYSLRTILTQLTAFHSTNTQFGTLPTMRGAYEMMRRAKNPALTKSREMNTRVMDVIVTEVAKQFAGTKMEKIDVVTTKGGLGGLKAFDWAVAESTWRTAYNSVAKKNKKAGTQKLNELETIRFADDAVIMTQGSGAIGNLSPIQMNAVGKALTLWQTFTIGHANFIARDVLGIGNPSLKPIEAAWRVVRYTTGMAIVNTLFEDSMGVQSPFPAPIKAIIKGLEKGDPSAAIALSVFMELTEIVPLMGAVKYASHPAGAVMNYFGELTKALSGNDPFHKDLLPKAIAGDKKAMLRITELIAKGTGVKGTGQVAKYVKAKKRGEEGFHAVMGRYREKKSKVGGRRTKLKKKLRN